jgi:hypothetical protein
MDFTPTKKVDIQKGHLLRPGSRYGSGSDQKGPDPTGSATLLFYAAGGDNNTAYKSTFSNNIANSNQCSKLLSSLVKCPGWIV